MTESGITLISKNCETIAESDEGILRALRDMAETLRGLPPEITALESKEQVADYSIMLRVERKAGTVE